MLISAFGGSALCTELLIYVRQRHQLVVCPQVLDEFERAMSKKFKVPANTVRAFRLRLEERSLVQPDAKRAPKRSRDPKDDSVLQSALDADCDWLVSGDKDLTSLKRVQGMPITTPRDFLEALGVEEPFD